MTRKTYINVFSDRRIPKISLVGVVLGAES